MRWNVLLTSLMAAWWSAGVLPVSAQTILQGAVQVQPQAAVAVPATTGGTATQMAGDDALLEMQQAFRKRDKAKLAQLLPATRGHVLEPWAAYWELRARLTDATQDEVQAFLSRWAGTYQEDRLRNDWLRQLGQRRAWGQFDAMYPAFRMGDDRELRCYAAVVDLVKGSAAATLADTVKTN